MDTSLLVKKILMCDKHGRPLFENACWNHMSWYKCDVSASMTTNRGRLQMLLTTKFLFIPSEVGSFPLSHPLFFYDAVDPM
jgi:hypothetical protein